MPNVPSLPGVPTLSSYSLAPVLTIAARAAGTIALINSFFLPKWGIFQNGAPVVIADNVIEMDFKREWNISDFPLEQGAFESYDKVSAPFEARLRFSSGGDQAKRAAFLASIDEIAGSFALLDISTPEKNYEDVNVIHYDYRRTAERGVGLIVVDVVCREVRESATATQSFANTALPSGTSPVSNGQVVPGPPNSQQQTQIGQGK